MTIRHTPASARRYSDGDLFVAAGLDPVAAPS